MKTLIGCFLLASLALAFTAKAGYDAYKVEQAQQDWAKKFNLCSKSNTYEYCNKTLRHLWKE
ncbi:hypothetical protein [Escherichia phage vB-Eco-KMB14]|uniref:Uncharacterized protein n=4 Tax=Vectrevirus TaxID=2732928 RepID=A0AAE8C5P5_9CAUD|nr:hypothetical protein D860_gp46 [Escherichia phage vB_EcoP_ACG-C91]YP_009795380.1 hypothetical protein HOS42_gp07 [Escherichia phage mutPK1A2]AQY55035.1 hypothetical protein [Escherichia phage K1E]QZI84601.1 hypothetical protein UTI89UKE2_067 [Escherichia phage vB_EcoP-UTI89UKE2]QZI84668.1 hypothetical protein UTI89UKE3_067 [Escherichia phage vB_EcoP-UTI89UKE3]WPK27869.1 hypothetical protein [Escherichia phage vB-Eco-KMB14]AFH19834.1 hypothetical protein ACG-C91_0009 [Escherichia phage vB_E